jgi:hypothetical protein
MNDALTDLDKAVIEALGAHFARGGEAAFDEAASRLVVWHTPAARRAWSI